MELQQSIVFENSSFYIGKIYDVMIEGRIVDKEQVYVGRTYMDAPQVDGYIFINSDEELMSGDIIQARVTGANNYDLIGEIVKGSAKMNLPNRITIIRVFMIPLYLVFMLIPQIPYGRYIAGVVFVIAALTDALDGYIARKHNLITNFGKFMDPLADKLLVCSALICFVEFQLMPG